MVMVPPEDNCVVGVKANVSFAPALFNTRSKGSMVTRAADTEVAET